MTVTLNEMITATGKDVLDHLDRQATVPQISVAAVQGDVAIHRVNAAQRATKPMPPTVVVVESEISTNTHTLHPNGRCYWDGIQLGGLRLGVLTVPDGSTAFLSHQEHGGIEIMPGTYIVGRQREWRSEWQMIAD